MKFLVRVSLFLLLSYADSLNTRLIKKISAGFLSLQIGAGLIMSPLPSVADAIPVVGAKYAVDVSNCIY
jgi:hypothetical protein